MKRCIILALVGLGAWAALGLGAGSADEPGRAPLRLAVQLRDGSLLVGRAELDSLKMVHQSGGRIAVPLDRIETVDVAEDGEMVTVRLRNGDSLTGALDVGVVTVRTAAGPQAVPVGKIARLAVLAAEPARLADGLVAHYRLDGDAKDAGGQCNHGQVHGAKPGADRFGWADHAFCFDGDGDYIEAPGSESLRLGGSFTLSAWVRTTGAAGRSQYIVRQGDFSRARYRFGLRVFDNGAGSFNTRDGNASFGAWTPRLKVGRWYHLVGVYDAKAATLAFYLGGGEVGKAANVRIVGPGPEPLVIGAEHYGGLKNFFAGQIDDVRVYDRALSAGEVIELHVIEASPPPPATQPDEGGG